MYSLLPIPYWPIFELVPVVPEVRCKADSTELTTSFKRPMKGSIAIQPKKGSIARAL